MQVPVFETGSVKDISKLESTVSDNCSWMWHLRERARKTSIRKW